jgi:hypothetical protein
MQGRRCNKSLRHGLKCMRENLCRPCGTRINFPLYPALERWATIFRPSGADLLANYARFSHHKSEDQVLTHGLKSVLMNICRPSATPPSATAVLGGVPGPGPGLISHSTQR